MAKTDLTAQRLRELLHYDPNTGVFTWLKRIAKRIHVNDIAGQHSNGYLVITVDGAKRMAHRLAWLYSHGTWPKNHIDHINGNPLDNRLCNLRNATNAENMQNQRKAGAGSSTGFLGVHKRRNKWRARITTNGVLFELGTFDAPEDAYAAYLLAKRRLHSTCTI